MQGTIICILNSLNEGQLIVYNFSNGLTIKSPSLKRRNSNISRVTRDDTVSNENGVEDKEVQTRLTKARISTQTHDSKDEGEKADWLKKLQHKLKVFKYRIKIMIFSQYTCKVHSQYNSHNSAL